MSLSSILDSVPQVPSDYSNHLIYGGALGLATFAICYYFYPLHLSLQIATAIPFVLCLVKKVDDHLVKNETIGMCVGKTVVTALLPVMFLLASYLK
jgi:hypothetical protein